MLHIYPFDILCTLLWYTCTSELSCNLKLKYIRVVYQAKLSGSVNKELVIM